MIFDDSTMALEVSNLPQHLNWYPVCSGLELLFGLHFRRDFDPEAISKSRQNNMQPGGCNFGSSQRIREPTFGPPLDILRSSYQPLISACLEIKNLLMFVLLLFAAISFRSCSSWESKLLATSVVPQNQTVHPSLDHERVVVSKTKTRLRPVETLIAAFKGILRSRGGLDNNSMLPPPTKCPHPVFYSTPRKTGYSVHQSVDHERVFVSNKNCGRSVM